MASVKPLQVREPSWLGECTLRRLQGASTSRSHAFGSLSVAAFFSFLQRPSLFISLSLEEKWQLLNFYRSLNFIYKQRPASWLLILIPNSWERVCDRPAWCNRESDLTFDICPLTVWNFTLLFSFGHAFQQADREVCGLTLSLVPAGNWNFPAGRNLPNSYSPATNQGPTHSFCFVQASPDLLVPARLSLEVSCVSNTFSLKLFKCVQVMSLDIRTKRRVGGSILFWSGGRKTLRSSTHLGSVNRVIAESNLRVPFPVGRGKLLGKDALNTLFNLLNTLWFECLLCTRHCSRLVMSNLSLHQSALECYLNRLLGAATRVTP